MRIGDNIPSRTPEGDRLHCDVCDRTLRLEVSLLSQDATCPFCGALVWKSEEPAADGPVIIVREPKPDPIDILWAPDWRKMKLKCQHCEGPLPLENAVFSEHAICPHCSQPLWHEAHPLLPKETPAAIQVLVGEMRELCLHAQSLPVLLYGFADRLTSALVAIGGVVWEVPTSGEPLVLAKFGAPPDASLDSVHLRLVTKALDRPDAMMVMPGRGRSDDVNPTSLLLLLAPLRREVGNPLVLEVFQRPNPNARVQRGYLRFVQQMSELLKEGLRNVEEREHPARELVFKDHWFARWIAWLCRILHLVETPRAGCLT